MHPLLGRSRLLFVFIAALTGVTAWDPPVFAQGSNLSVTAALPNYQSRFHDVGNIRLRVSNLPSLPGGGTLTLNCSNLPVPNFGFPANSVQSFRGGGLWLGGIVRGDTLVSSGSDGLRLEFNPKPAPDGALLLRTIRDEYRSGPLCEPIFKSADAISELDIISDSYDTVTSADITGTNPFETRPHTPLGLQVTMKSFGWSYGYARNFLLIEYVVKNIAYHPRGQYTDDQTIHRLYVGQWWRGTTYLSGSPVRGSTRGFNDDLIGLLSTARLPWGDTPEDTVNVVWTADNDGDPGGGGFDAESVPAAMGLRILAPLDGELQYAYNWFVSDELTVLPDWGPAKRSAQGEPQRSPVGFPLTDREKYRMMSNGEIDYPFLEAAKSHEADGWLPPPPTASVLSYGSYGMDYLVSVGPFDLELGDSITFAIALVGCENFHTDPGNYRRFFDPSDQTRYLEGLNFEELGKNAQWAGWVYDTPGFDTDGDGYAGAYHLVGDDTLYYRGDGVPDYKGPGPPTPPHIRSTTAEGMVILRWNGVRAEHEVDLFSKRVDFEGYRVFMSRTGRTADWALLAGRDLINYARFTWNHNRLRWERLDPPFTLDALKVLYDSISIEQFGYPFHPDSFRSGDPDRALLEVLWDPENPVRIDSLYRRFEPFEDNAMVDDWLYRDLAARGQEVIGVIRKLYPDAPPDSLAVRADGTEFFPYYEYEYVIDGLQVAEPIFFSVATFDNGEGDIGLGPLQSDPRVNAVELWPINSVAIVKTERPKPGVYPNPYRISDDYNAAGWENPRGMEPDKERARKVTFYNVPDTCIVSIWSLDGDLIRRLDHKSDPTSSEASVVVWNLITRNTQAIKTGIYLYSIESRFGTDVGKLVIIK